MLRNVISFFSFFKLPLLSGILIGTSYIPLPPWALLFCFVPLWYFCLKNKHQLKNLLWAGWFTQFVLTLIGFHWVTYTINVFSAFHWSLAFLGFLLFCSFSQLHIPIALGIWHYCLRLKPFQTKWASSLLLPTLTAIGFSIFPMIFPWHLGYSWFQPYLPAFHTAELWGFEFLSTITLFVQLCFLPLSKKYFKMGLPLSLALLLILNIGGYYLKIRLKEPDQSSNVLVVQHNIYSPQAVKKSSIISNRKTIRRLFSLTKKGLKNHSSVDFIVWSEAAYPYLIFEKDKEFSSLQKEVKKNFKTPLITGASTRIGNQFTNSIFFLQPSGKFHPDRYDKNILLAFGEYIPGEQWFPSLKKFFLNTHASIMRGAEGPQVREISSVKLGLQICYEGLFPHFSRTLSQKGAQILLNLTNDSWFGWWYQPYQHLYMTLARGIELRKPVIRTTKTGFSAVMDAQGNITRSPMLQTWVTVLSVPYQKETQPTIFERWGYHINKVFLLLMLLIPFIVFYSNKLKNFFKKNKSS